MRTLPILFCLAGLLSSLTAAAPTNYKAGVSAVDITPSGPIWLSGYASRNKPSEGVLQRLWAKALALEDSRGTRLIIVTTDLIGLPRTITDVVGVRIEKQFNIPRGNLLLNSSHTHTGPMIRGNLVTLADLPDNQQRVIQDYATQLTDQLVKVIAGAVAAIKP